MSQILVNTKKTTYCMCTFKEKIILLNTSGKKTFYLDKFRESLQQF